MEKAGFPQELRGKQIEQKGLFVIVLLQDQTTHLGETCQIPHAPAG